jgi:hypothetical protein
MKINIKTIPHKSQTYETCGNWQLTNTKNGEPVFSIQVSELGDWRMELLIAVHELVEVALCKQRRITQKQVDKFDLNYEADRLKGLHGEDDEPGDDPKSPYRREHFFATNIEALLSAELGVDWQEYEKRVYALDQSK